MPSSSVAVASPSIGGLNEALALGPFDRWESATFHRVGPFAKTQHHLIGIKGRAHNAMIEASDEIQVGIMDTQLSTPGLWSPPVMACDQ
jgi:hypothetical protein